MEPAATAKVVTGPNLLFMAFLQHGSKLTLQSDKKNK